MAHSSRKPHAQPAVAGKPTRPATKRSLSVPLLVGTIVALLVLLPGLYFWRLKQVERGADVYRDRAEALAKQEKWAQSADYLFLYLRLRPDDVDARIQLAETYDRTASQRPQLSRAVELYYQALSKAPLEEQRALRLRLSELLMQTEQFASAQAEADTLLKIDEKDPQASRVKALALYGAATGGGLDAEKFSPADVGAALETANRLNPADVTVAMTLVEVYRRQPQFQSDTVRTLSDAQRATLADQCLDTLVLSAPKEASAYLARYQDRLSRTGDKSDSQAEGDLQQALQLAPDNPVVLLAAGANERRKAVSGDLDQSQRNKHLLDGAEFYARALRAAATLDRAYIGLGELQLLQGEADRAVKTWEVGLEKCGQDNIPLNLMLADELISQRAFERADKSIQRLKSTAFALRQRGFLEAQLSFDRGADLLAARLQLAKGNTDAAVESLQQIIKGGKAGPGEGFVNYQARMLLGGIYESQDQTDLALRAFEDAASMQPSSAEPHLAMARLWLTRDRADLAADFLRKAVSLNDNIANRILLVGSILQSQLRLPPGKRDWTAVDTSLAEAKRAAAESASSDAWRLGILESEYRYRRESSTNSEKAGIQSAVAVLRDTEKSTRATEAASIGLIEAYERYGSTADTDRLLKQIREQFPTSSAAYLVAAQVAASRKQFDQASAALADGLNAVSKDQQTSLRLAAVGIDLEQGNSDKAWTHLAALHQEFPNDQRILERLLELAIDTGRFTDAAELDQQLEHMPGLTGGDLQYYRARRLLAMADGPQDERLKEADQSISESLKAQPNASRLHLVRGELLERRGNFDDAIEAFRQAITLGDRRPLVYERMIMLLYQLERFDEANQYLTALGEAVPASTGLSTLEISTALREGDSARALKLAQRGVEQRPTDPLAHVWLGQLLIASNKPADAEKALQRAVELNPSDPRTQGAMMNFLVRTRQLDRARALLREFAEKREITPAQRALLLAAGLEAIGDRKEALEQLREAEKLDPQDARVHERIGIALFDQDSEQAEQSLRRALDINPKSNVARRVLASLLAARGGEKNWQAAVDLLNDPGAGGSSAQANLRLQAIVLARRGGEDNLAKAHAILESLVKESKTSTRADRLLLAKLTETQGNSAEAGKQLLALASETGALPEHVAAYADWLLRQDRAQEATPWLDKLEHLDANNLAAVALRCRWLKAVDRATEIEEELEKTAERLLKSQVADKKPTDEQKLETCLTVGDLYLSVGQYPAAERWYRRAYALDPMQFGRLARCVAEQGRLSEAIELCTLAASKDATHVPATTLAQILVQSKPGPADFDHAEPTLAAALSQHAAQADLLGAMANLRLVQHRLEDATQLYRRLVELQPNNVHALNNLAMALAEQEGHGDEALTYLDRAIEIVGQDPNLLDSKGTILLSQNKVEDALSLLRVAASTPDPDPRFLFHLAVGHYRAGDLAKAREVLADARKRELERTVLTTSDTKLLAELDDKLN